MPHKLMEKLHMIGTTLRYQCPCDNREVIALTVMFNEIDFQDEFRFLEAMRIARLDMITEIRQHTGLADARKAHKPRLP
jgi:hypothetical protein